MKHLLVVAAACCLWGCASRPSPEARAVVSAVAEAYGIGFNEPGAACEADRVCEALDANFTKEELLELQAVFSDRRVRQLLRETPVDAALLDSRVKALSKTGAILKFSDAELQSKIFQATAQQASAKAEGGI